MSVEPGAGANRTAEIAAGLSEVRARIEQACAAAGRPAGSVHLVVVTKTFPASDVRILHSLGCLHIAENRDQEARAKHDELTADAPSLRWHMIGQVQRNKARSVATWADVIESVDRLSLAEALSAGAVAANRVIEVLLQVSLDPGEPGGRGGVPPTEVPALCAAVAQLPGLTVRGVMGVAPYPGDPESAFDLLESTADRLREADAGANVISAGMSADLEAAIRYGATQVRIGGAILGNRTLVR